VGTMPSSIQQCESQSYDKVNCLKAREVVCILKYRSSIRRFSNESGKFTEKSEERGKRKEERGRQPNFWFLT
jgi:hypothetical protein